MSRHTSDFFFSVISSLSAKQLLSPSFHSHSFFERLSLGARWVFSLQQVLLPDNRPLFPTLRWASGQKVVAVTWTRQRIHFIRIAYHDENNAPQVAIFEVPKKMPLALLAILQQRAPQSCKPQAYEHCRAQG